MLVSSRGRYALTLMIDLAEQNPDNFIPLRIIANRQRISKKYLENIIAMLNKSGLVISLRGKGGGYKLAKKPHQYTVGSILKSVEETLCPILNLNKHSELNSNDKATRTTLMWKNLDKMINDYFENITIIDLL